MQSIFSKLAVAFPLLCISFSGTSQFNDNFSDGNFTTAPVWQGNTADFTVNASQQLQSNNTVANSSFYLSTANTLATSAQWEFYHQITFNPSSANYIDVFLTASAADLSLSSTSGYFVRIGNTDDEISLYRKDATGTVTEIIDGANGILNTSNNVMKIKVLRTATGQWTLFRDLTGTGNTYTTEGVTTDATFTTSSFFGIFIRQSTASFFQRHFFDDLVVAPYVPDVTPPSIQSVTANAPNAIEVLFSEPVDATTAQTLTNYAVNNSVGNPTAAVRDAGNIALVRLTFATNFPNGINCTVTANGVQDLSGNAIVNGTGNFSFYIPKRYDVLMDEILADPTPVIGLPNAEFVELKNTSGKNINLLGWRISSATATSSPFTAYLLPADSFLVITSTANAALFNSYGRVLGVAGFPSLDNTGTTLSLVSREGLTIHAVNYNVSWYQNAVKSDGGWSLEMIDTKNPCSGSSNWRASTDARGGTPASKNSIDGNNIDNTAPALLKAAAINPTTISLTFDEPLDSLKAATTANYSFSNGLAAPIAAVCIAPGFTRVDLTIATPLQPNVLYTVTAANITDCKGNTIGVSNNAKFGLASVADSLNVVINEVLFNPVSNNVDFIEIYNRSNKIIDLKDIFIANRSSTTNALGSLRQLTTESTLLFPNTFYVISENGSLVKQKYLAKNPANFIDVSSMPSYPDDKGTVVILNNLGAIIDQLAYDEKWHFELIDNEEGISLERIDYNKPTQNKDNWHSAATSVGYATPSYQNSQFRADVQVQGDVTVTPKIFSPDNDGFDDFTFINYKLSENGYAANITIFDAQGRPVKVLLKNGLLGLSGSFRWDGLDDKLKKVPVGPYVVFTEIYNLQGKKRQFKQTVIVAARF
jgi:hypothetical protein